MEYNFTDQIKKLSVAERILLVEEIWDSIAHDNDAFDLSQDQKDELDKRAQSFSGGRTWEEIKAEFSKSA